MWKKCTPDIRPARFPLLSPLHRRAGLSQKHRAPTQQGRTHHSAAVVRTPAQPREGVSALPHLAAAGFVIRRTRAGLQIPPQQQRTGNQLSNGCPAPACHHQSAAVVRTPAQPRERASALLRLAAAGFVIRRTRAGLQIPPQQERTSNQLSNGCPPPACHELSEQPRFMRCFSIPLILDNMRGRGEGKREEMTAHRCGSPGGSCRLHDPIAQSPNGSTGLASEAVPSSQDLTESLLSGIITVELALSRLEC